jgi:hypothetical protein
MAYCFVLRGLIPKLHQENYGIIIVIKEVAFYDPKLNHFNTID